MKRVVEKTHQLKVWRLSLVCSDRFQRDCKKKFRIRDDQDMVVACETAFNAGWRKNPRSGVWTCDECMRSRLPLDPRSVFILQQAGWRRVVVKGLTETPSGLVVDCRKGTFHNAEERQRCRIFSIGDAALCSNDVLGVFHVIDKMELQAMIMTAVGAMSRQVASD